MAADVTLTVYDVARAGVDLTANKTTIVVVNTYYFPNSGGEKIYIKNTTGSTVTMTAVTPNTVDGNAIADKTATLATAKEGLFGPWPPNFFNDDQGRVKATFDQTVDVTIVRG